MKIQVKIKPNARHEKIITHDDGRLELHIKAPPIEGRANAEVIRLLAKHFKVTQADIQIVAGEHSKNKVIRLNKL